MVPTAHYFMGGVVVDVDTRTEMEGLYVAGEDAGGAHGSNRLGGNGVANSTVFGGIAGDVMARDLKVMTLRDPDEAVLDAELERAVYPLSRTPANWCCLCESNCRKSCGTTSVSCAPGSRHDARAWRDCKGLGHTDGDWR